jgi:ABC-type phosphate transport system substrate-binding protein
MRSRAAGLARMSLPLLLILLCGLLSSSLVDASLHYDHGKLTRDASIHIRVGATGSSNLWLAKAAQAYGMRREDVEIEIDTAFATSTATSTRVALKQLQRGESDVAFLPMTPTAAEKQAAPDLLYLPFWATAFAPVYNLPTSEVGDDLVLSLPVLAKIFMGNITKSVQPYTKGHCEADNTYEMWLIMCSFVLRIFFRWNHPSIVALNPNAVLVNRDIIMALHGDSFNLMAQLTIVLGQIDPEFATLVPSSNVPRWPLSKYARYKLDVGLDGPTGFVASTPYSITVAFVSIADRFQVRCVKLINPFGNAVLPTYHTIASGFNERVISSSRITSGSDIVTYNSDLTPGLGPNAWPLLFAVTLVIPKDYSTQSCVVRSELVKYIRWMINTADIKYNLAISESTSMISSETDSQLLVQHTIATLSCHGEPISNGDRDPIMFGGVTMVHHHFNLRDIWLSEFTRIEKVAEFEYAPMDEGEGMMGLLQANSQPDMLWFCPATARIMYPSEYQSIIESEETQTLHAGMFAIVPNYQLPNTAEKRMRDKQQELVIDMETLALVFLGDITEWTDARLTARNPQLITAFAGEDPTITVLWCGTGVMAEAPLTPAGNHLALALNRTAAFRDAGITMTLPVDWTELAARRDAKGAKYVSVPNERSMEAATSRIPGAISYLIFSGAANDVNLFRLARRVLDANGTWSENIVAPTVQSLLALANGTKPTQDIDWVEKNAISDSPLLSNAWPIPMAFSMAVATAASTGRSVGLSVESICFRQRQAVKFVEWMTTVEIVTVASEKAGRGDISSLPDWMDFFQLQLNKCTCQGEPILYIAPVIWEMPTGVRGFSQATAAIGLALAALTIVLIVLFRHRTIFQVASLLLQLVALTGMVMLFVAAIVYAEAPSTSSCSALGWLLSVGAACMFSPMCAKLFRVYHLASQQKKRNIRIRKLSNRTLIAGVGVWIVMHVIILGIAQSKAGGVLTPETLTRFEITRDHIYTQCSMVKSNAYSYVAIGLHAALLVVTVLVSFGLMRISSPFSESRHISWSLWNSMLTVLIVIPILIVSGGMQSDTGSFLIVFLLVWVTLTTLCFTFGYKLYHLMSEEWMVFMTMRQESSLRGSASGVSGASSHLTKSSKTEGSSTGMMGSDNKQLDLDAALQLPNLGGTGIMLLEKYITALETQIRMARAKRHAVFGDPSPVPIGGYATIQLTAIEEEDRKQATWPVRSASPATQGVTMRPRAANSISVHVSQQHSMEVSIEPMSPVRIDAASDGGVQMTALSASSPYALGVPSSPGARRKAPLGVGIPSSSPTGARSPMRITTIRTVHTRSVQGSPDSSPPLTTRSLTAPSTPVADD